MNYRELIAVLKDMEVNQITRLRKQLGEVISYSPKHSFPTPRFNSSNRTSWACLEGYRLQMVEIGAAGRLLVSGEIERYFHWRTMNRSTRPTPSLSMERVRFDALKVQARQDAIVKNLLKGGSFDLMILGGDYDLSESVRRLGDAKCEYVRVTTGRFGNVAGN